MKMIGFIGRIKKGKMYKWEHRISMMALTQELVCAKP